MKKYTNGIKDYYFEDFNVDDVFSKDDVSLTEHFNTVVKPIAIKLSNELMLSEKSAFTKLKKRKGKDLENPKVKKKTGPWTEDESTILLDCMKKTPRMSWTEISKFIPERNRKQIRERWNNVLNPEINKSPFSEKEKDRIRELVSVYGKKWTQIVKELKNGRRENSVKNYYNSYLLAQLNAK